MDTCGLPAVVLCCPLLIACFSTTCIRKGIFDTRPTRKALPRKSRQAFFIRLRLDDDIIDFFKLPADAFFYARDGIVHL